LATSHPRVQVTVDPELAEALAAQLDHASSRSRLIRDLALRGAEAQRHDREREAEALEYLAGIANGEIDFDFDALREIHAEREHSA